MKVNTIQQQNFNGLRWTGDNIFAISKAAGLDKIKADMLKKTCDNLPFPKGTEVWLLKPSPFQTTSRIAGSRKRGAVIAITGDDICKGVVMDPITCNDKMLAYKYALAMRKLAKANFSPTNNAKKNITWVG